jgi:hypothetical protein
MRIEEANTRACAPVLVVEVYYKEQTVCGILCNPGSHRAIKKFQEECHRNNRNAG